MGKGGVNLQPLGRSPSNEAFISASHLNVLRNSGARTPNGWFDLAPRSRMATFCDPGATRLPCMSGTTAVVRFARRECAR